MATGLARDYHRETGLTPAQRQDLRHPALQQIAKQITAGQASWEQAKPRAIPSVMPNQLKPSLRSIPKFKAHDGEFGKRNPRPLALRSRPTSACVCAGQGYPHLPKTPDYTNRCASQMAAGNISVQITTRIFRTEEAFNTAII